MLEVDSRVCSDLWWQDKDFRLDFKTFWLQVENFSLSKQKQLTGDWNASLRWKMFFPRSKNSAGSALHVPAMEMIKSWCLVNDETDLKDKVECWSRRNAFGDFYLFWRIPQSSSAETTSEVSHVNGSSCELLHRIFPSHSACLTRKLPLNHFYTLNPSNVSGLLLVWLLKTLEVSRVLYSFMLAIRPQRFKVISKPFFSLVDYGEITAAKSHFNCAKPHCYETSSSWAARSLAAPTLKRWHFENESEF